MPRPTLFRVLLEERRRNSWVVFCPHFERTARKLSNVARLRMLPPVRLDITTVDLVELRKTDGTQRAYRCMSYGRLPFTPRP